MAGVLYAPAFAAVTVWFDAQRIRALTAITLVAGLASTVFAPPTAVLSDHLSWRGTYLVLALFLAFSTAPAHYFALRPRWPRPQRSTPTTAPSSPATRDTVVPRYTLACLAAAFTLSTVGVYAAGTASVILGLGGIGQVAGRLGYGRLARRLTLLSRTASILAASALVTGLLGLVPGPLWLLAVTSVLAGNARGLYTLVQATAVSDRWGAAHYARINGVFTAPVMAASALAPFIGAGLAGLLDSYPAAFASLATIGGLVAALTA